MIGRALTRLLQAPVRFYRRSISPLLGHHCRFMPTCSQYMLEALEVHGPVKGLLLGLWRLVRCQPLCRWGYDPVPPKGRWVSPERRLYR